MVEPEAVPAQAPGAPVAPGGSDVVGWINDSTRVDQTVHSAIPAGHARYATVLIPADGRRKTRSDLVLVDVLRAHTAEQPWWLGYLDTGVADLVDVDAPRVSLYVGWTYALVEGGPQQALTSRTLSGSTPWHSALPELMFPSDRTWLVSTLWDDDWRCIGGPAALVDAVVMSPELQARVVLPEEHVAPPGHDLR